MSFCAVLFPRGVLDEILNLIESVSEGFPSYSYSMLSLSDHYQSDVIEAFNSTSRYLHDLLNIDNNFFEIIASHILSFRSSVEYGQRVRYRGLICGYTFIYIGWLC